MPNPKDFSARQIRTSQLMASGGIAGSKVGLVIYSASNASDILGGFTKDASMLTDVGDDVFFFVSGSKNSKVSRGDTNNGEQGVTLFGGDVVFSGTLYAERMVVEVDQSTTGSLLVSGSLFVSRSATIHEGLIVNASGEPDTENDFLVKGTAGATVIFGDASLKNVGIGTSSPLSRAVCTINILGLDSFSEFNNVNCSPEYSLNLVE